MRNIDKKYIFRAKEIRNDFLNINSDIEKKENRLKTVKDKIQNISIDLKKFQEDIKKTKNPTLEVNKIFKSLEELSIEYQKIENLIKPMLERLEKIKKDELILFDTILRTYPELKAEEIKQQVQQQILE